MLTMSTILSSILMTAFAQGADKPACANLSGQYRLDSVESACKDTGNGRILTFRPYLDLAGPPQDGLYLVPDGVNDGNIDFIEGQTWAQPGQKTSPAETLNSSKDSVFIPNGGVVDIEQHGCDSLTVTYEDMVVNSSSLVTEHKQLARTLSLKSPSGKANFKLDKDGLEAESGYAHFEDTEAGPSWERNKNTWSLSLDKSGDLVYSATNRHRERLAILPIIGSKEQQSVTCHLRKIGGHAIN